MIYCALKRKVTVRDGYNKNEKGVIMRKYAVLCACGLAAAMMFTGCGQKEETAETTQAQTESAAETDDTEGADQGPEITGEVELGE